jgi:hypothetical protein
VVAQPNRLQPKEHGAYAILALPTASSLWLGGFPAVAWLIAAASLAGFLAHEPLLVASGKRGGRAQQATPGAIRRLLVLLALAVVAGLAALAWASPPVRWSLLGCLALAGVTFAFSLTGRHRSFGGQLLGVVSLSAPCVPMLLAGARPDGRGELVAAARSSVAEAP